MSETLVPNLNTFADLIDRLIVEVNKLAFFENKKREEHAKEWPDTEMIAHWDNLSRDCCEYRSALKNKINEMLTDIVNDRSYQTLKEIRTFRGAPRSIADILDEMCYSTPERVREELAKAFSEQVFNNN